MRRALLVALGSAALIASAPRDAHAGIFLGAQLDAGEGLGLPSGVNPAGFGFLGTFGYRIFLGPVFPTTMASVPRLTRARLVPTAMGVLNAASVIGGAVLPWLVGTIAQSEGMRVLLPFVLVLGLGQFAVWRPIAKRLE